MDYYEVLGHSEGEVDLSRYEAGAMPLLFNHDMDLHLGSVDNAYLQDKKLYVGTKFSQSRLATEKWQDVQDGVLRSSSIRYRIHELEKWGERDGKPIYRATNWEAIEASLVSVPADPSVGVGRSLEYVIDPEKGTKLALPKYKVPVISGRNFVPDRRSLEYYLPSSGASIARQALALEALINSTEQATGLTESERGLILSEGYELFTKGVKEKMSLKDKPQVQPEGQQANTDTPDVANLQRQLEELRAEKDADRRALQEAQDMLKRSALQSRYDRVRSKMTALTDPITGTITPATLRTDFAETPEEDYERIAKGEIGEAQLIFLEQLAERYANFPKNGHGVTPFTLPAAPSRSEDDKTVKGVVDSTANNFAREFSGVRTF